MCCRGPEAQRQLQSAEELELLREAAAAAEERAARAEAAAAEAEAAAELARRTTEDALARVEAERRAGAAAQMKEMVGRIFLALFCRSYLSLSAGYLKQLYAATGIVFCAPPD